MTKANPKTATKNRFSGIVDANRAREAETSPESETPNSSENSTKRRGKSSHPEFLQVSAYLRKDTHKTARKLLMDDEQRRDLSDLMEQLLQEWISTQS